MKMKMMFMALSVLLLTAPPVIAEEPADEAVAAFDLTVVNGKTVYVGHDGSLWEEANGTPGLQSSQVAYKTRVVEPDAPLILV